MTAISRVLRHGAWPTLEWVLVAVSPVVFLWATSAALTGVVSVVAALSIGGATAALAFTILLVRLALLLPHGACRGAGFLAMGVLAGGVGLFSSTMVRSDWRESCLTGGFVLSAGLYLLGLLLLPGTAPNWRSRLRRALDGFGIGISLFFGAWMLIIVPLAGDGPGPVGPRAMLAVLVWLIASAAMASAALITLRAVRYRGSAVLCGAGVLLALCGQALLVVLSLVGAAVPYLFGALAGTVLGPMLLWLGARRNGMRLGVLRPAEDGSSFAGMPLLSVPVALAMSAAIYHLATVGSFGTYSAAIGVLVVVAVATREIFAVFDVRRYAARLVDQEARFRSMVSGSSDVTMLLDESLVVRWQSPAAARQLGLSDADVLGRAFSSLFHPQDAPTLTEQLQGLLLNPPDRPVLAAARIRDGFGRYQHTESTAVDHRGEPAVAGLVVHIRDVGERLGLERTMHRMAFTDPLTGLSNRRALLRGLTELGQPADGRPPWSGSVLVIDLGGLQAVNDAQGREVGDGILIEVARRLQDCLGPGQQVARLGGDEFAVLTSEPADVAHATAHRLLLAVGAPFELGGGRTVLTANVGLAGSCPGATPAELIAGAEVAMRRARESGPNRVHSYDESLEVQLLRHSLLTAELPGADQRGELDLVFQPIVALEGPRPVAAEALLRWRHPQLGTVLPAELVPIAEQAGMIGPIGDWVLHRACRCLAGWLAEGRDLQVAVNISATQLHQPDFLAEVAAVLDAYDVPPERLIMEFTENGVVRDVRQAVTQLGGLRALGVRTALDDFGSGGASLTYLRRLPIDVLKVDRTLVTEPDNGPGIAAEPLTELVVRLGQRLGMQVIAEGVETAEQLAALRAAGCRYAQGYLFSMPVPLERVEAFFDLHDDGAGPVVTT